MTEVFGSDADLGNAVLFDVHLTVGAEVEGLIDELVSAALAFHDLAETEQRRARFGATLRCFLANLQRARAKASTATVGIFLRPQSYSRNRYRRDEITYVNVSYIVNFLRDCEPPLIEVHRGSFPREAGSVQRRQGAVGRTSRIRATRHLVQRMEESIRAFSRVQGLHSITGNEITSFSLFAVQQDQESIRLKDHRKNLTDYDDTDETRGMRQNLLGWNQFASLHWMDLLVPDDEARRISHSGMVSETDTQPEDDVGAAHRGVDLTRRRLHRVFNGSFDRGGRFYGGWWQEIPSDYRRFITINWAPTRELDYSNMQAAMLYAREGVQLEGDAYAVEGIEPSAQNRKLIKQTFFKLINAAEGQRTRAPRRGQLPPGWTWNELQEAVRERHAPIARYLNSGIGIELQRIDADVAEDVMLTLMRDNILVLPVHDSFLAYRAQYGRLRQEMERAYRERTGADIEIDMDLGFADTLLGEPVDPLDDEDQFVIDAWEHLENDPAYSSYFARRRIFLSRVDDAWRWRFTAG